MEEKKEYLNEESYQKVKKGVNKVGIVMFVIGILMVIAGIALVLIGFLSFGKDGGHSNFAMFTIGGFVLVFGFAIAGFGGQALFIGHAREIQAFAAQQSMPVAKEGIEKMAPTIGEAAKEISKGVAEGIEEGKKEANED